ncbi:MAG: acyl-CoA dehydrogenase family protein, partial [Rhodospirillales bacterium]|nr:acyl-CoA dehydrogenase family protein [Rhodospirillales bacterium]
MTIDRDTLDQLVFQVRRFVRERLIPLEREVDENDRIPDGIIGEMKELGLFGLSIPEEYGGLGLKLTEEIRVVQEIGYTAPAFRTAFGTNVGIGSQGILIDGTEAQKKKYLPKLASGEITGSFALTEPEAGSDAASVMTSARADGDYYIINGNKRFITNAPNAGLFTVMARTGTPEARGRGISAFLIEAKTPGIELGLPEKKMGFKGAPCCDVTFNNVRVHKEQIIGGKEGQGFKTAMKVLDRGRLHISAVSVGICRRLIDESVNYAIERKQFGERIADFQLIQAMIADSQTDYLAGKALVEASAEKYDAGIPVSTEASCCKLFCTEAAGRIADR